MKTILITGATDGIGLETARMLVSQGHRVLLHGRNPSKLESVVESLSAEADGIPMETHVADLSRFADVEAFAQDVATRHESLDVLINNAGVYHAPDTVTEHGLDIRFAVNTIAPYLLTKRLLPLLGAEGRVVNLSSAAQAPVDLQAMVGKVRLSDDNAYAQSKLAITMWTNAMARSIGSAYPMLVSVNPGSMLGSKMVKEAYGVAGGDLRIGADILVRAALSDEFKNATGQYYDNDAHRFAPPHPDALDPRESEAVVSVIEALLADMATSPKSAGKDL